MNHISWTLYLDTILGWTWGLVPNMIEMMMQHVFPKVHLFHRSSLALETLIAFHQPSQSILLIRGSLVSHPEHNNERFMIHGRPSIDMEHAACKFIFNMGSHTIWTVCDVSYCLKKWFRSPLMENNIYEDYNSISKKYPARDLFIIWIFFNLFEL